MKTIPYRRREASPFVTPHTGVLSAKNCAKARCAKERMKVSLLPAKLTHKGSPPALPGWQKQFDVSGSRPPFKVPPREPPRTRRNFDDGRVREPKSHEVGVQIPCRVHSQVPPEDPLWRAETASG